MSGSVAPALVESPDDLISYHVSDSSPVNPNADKGYLERFIHGELYKRYPGVNCVIHSHSEAVLPYASTQVPLVPVFHMAGFLGELSSYVAPGVVVLDKYRANKIHRKANGCQYSTSPGTTAPATFKTCSSAIPGLGQP
jgi:ribulose-5-phosphate 4-epimerase/fuculose-1-phosphate aldolase